MNAFFCKKNINVFFLKYQVLSLIFAFMNLIDENFSSRYG